MSLLVAFMYLFRIKLSVFSISQLFCLHTSLCLNKPSYSFFFFLGSCRCLPECACLLPRVLACSIVCVWMRFFVLLPGIVWVIEDLRVLMHIYMFACCVVSLLVVACV